MPNVHRWSLILAALGALASPAGAQGAADRWHAVPGDFVMRDFRFDDGETIPELRIHYVTLGANNRPAVLILHGTTGNGAGFLSPNFAGELFGPGQPLDTATHFIILPDGIGTGHSSKPSDGLHAKFPHYGYGDMVRAQHRLVTEGLGVRRLRLVMGTSMGAMQTWMWGEMYPDAMDALMPLASIPTQIAGRNRMMREIIADDIRGDPDWKNGEYTQQPRGLRAALSMLFMMTSSPKQQQKQFPTRDSAEHYIHAYLDRGMRTYDANDFLYQFEASRDYDPSSRLSSIRAPLTAINSADDQVNPPELGVIDTLITRVPNGRFVLIPISDQTRGHGTHSLPAIWKGTLVELLARSERP
jgi:homoserine O-acetyltransferase